MLYQTGSDLNIPVLGGVIGQATSQLASYGSSKAVHVCVTGPVEVQRITLPLRNVHPREETEYAHTHTTFYKQLEGSVYYLDQRLPERG